MRRLNFQPPSLQARVPAFWSKFWPWGLKLNMCGPNCCPKAKKNFILHESTNKLLGLLSLSPSYPQIHIGALNTADQLISNAFETFWCSWAVPENFLYSCVYATKNKQLQNDCRQGVKAGMPVLALFNLSVNNGQMDGRSKPLIGMHVRI